MNLKLLFAFLFLGSIQSFAQEKNISIEANYSAIPANGIGGEDLIIDFGLKYRFLQTEILNLGLSTNVGYLTNNSYSIISREEDNVFLFQPRVYSEFNLPFSKRLKPTLGLGYSFFTGASKSSNNSRTIGGFNVNIGLLYNISKKWYVQAHFDFVSLKSINAAEGYNNIRIGVGFRF